LKDDQLEIEFNLLMQMTDFDDALYVLRR